MYSLSESEFDPRSVWLQNICSCPWPGLLPQPPSWWQPPLGPLVPEQTWGKPLTPQKGPVLNFTQDFLSQGRILDGCGKEWGGDQGGEQKEAECQDMWALEEVTECMCQVPSRETAEEEDRQLDPYTSWDPHACTGPAEPHAHSCTYVMLRGDRGT